jgi:hypothetical protein
MESESRKWFVFGMATLLPALRLSSIDQCVGL